MIVLVRVAFLTAPFKASMIQRMASHFSSSVETLIIVLSRPYKRNRELTTFDKIRTQFLGEDSIRRTILAFGPDVIYSDTALHSAQTKLSCLAARHSIPFIIHLRGDWWHEYYSWFREATWRKRTLSSVQYTFNWYSLGTARKITPICKWLQRVVKCHLPWKRTEVIYQGVDPSYFDRTADRFEFEQPAVTLVQNHTVFPKVAGLLRFGEVIKRLPKVNFYVAEGGPYDQTYLPAVKRALAQLPNVHFVRGIEDAFAVRKMLNSADLYVLASELDCCPTTVLEASLMRKPVVASRVGGVPEIVLEGKTGWTVPNDSTELWIEKIQVLLEDRNLCDNLGRMGREWVESKFAWGTVASQVERLLIDESSA